jgi:YebC/PmpR family DNA-binding regulatory protein
MAGHSHWAGIKHKKEITDKKRGRIFSKLLTAITAAVKTEPNPDFNPRLRTAVEKARASKVPTDTIERAIKRASEAGEGLEELLFEAYGPGGSAIIIDVVASNKNRAVAEIKKILHDHEARWAEVGSVRWAFEMVRGEWQAKFPQSIDATKKERIRVLIRDLLHHEDVQCVYTNVIGLEKREDDEE